MPVDPRERPAFRGAPDEWERLREYVLVRGANEFKRTVAELEREIEELNRLAEPLGLVVELKAKPTES